VLRPGAPGPARRGAAYGRAVLGLARAAGREMRRLHVGAGRPRLSGSRAHEAGRLSALRRPALRPADARLRGALTGRPAMIFPTLNFLLFYLVVWPTAWALVLAGRHNLHKAAIIAASYFFYAFWSWRLALLLLGSVLLNWASGRLIGHAAGRPALK